jgi:hypothetical protein
MMSMISIKFFKFVKFKGRIIAGAQQIFHKNFFFFFAQEVKKKTLF